MRSVKDDHSSLDTRPLLCAVSIVHVITARAYLDSTNRKDQRGLTLICHPLLSDDVANKIAELSKELRFDVLDCRDLVRDIHQSHQLGNLPLAQKLFFRPDTDRIRKSIEKLQDFAKEHCLERHEEVLVRSVFADLEKLLIWYCLPKAKVTPIPETFMDGPFRRENYSLQTRLQIQKSFVRIALKSLAHRLYYSARNPRFFNLTRYMSTWPLRAGPEFNVNLLHPESENFQALKKVVSSLPKPDENHYKGRRIVLLASVFKLMDMKTQAEVLNAMADYVAEKHNVPLSDVIVKHHPRTSRTDWKELRDRLSCDILPWEAKGLVEINLPLTNPPEAVYGFLSDSLFSIPALRRVKTICVDLSELYEHPGISISRDLCKRCDVPIVKYSDITSPIETAKKNRKLTSVKPRSSPDLGL